MSTLAAWGALQTILVLVAIVILVVLIVVRSKRKQAE